MLILIILIIVFNLYLTNKILDRLNKLEDFTVQPFSPADSKVTEDGK